MGSETNPMTALHPSNYMMVSIEIMLIFYLIILCHL